MISRIVGIACIWFIVWLVGLLPAAITSAVSTIATIATLLFVAIFSGPGSDQAMVAFGFALFYLGIPIGIPAGVLLGMMIYTTCMFLFCAVHIVMSDTG